MKEYNLIDKEQRKKILELVWFHERHKSFDEMFDKIISQEQAIVKHLEEQNKQMLEAFKVIYNAPFLSLVAKDVSKKTYEAITGKKIEEDVWLR